VGHIFYRFWDIATKTSGNRRPFYPTQIHWKDWSFADIFANFGLKKLESLDHCHSTVKTACSYVQSSRHWYRKLPLQNCWFHPFNAQSSGEFMHGPYVAVAQGCLSAAASLDLSWFIFYTTSTRKVTHGKVHGVSWWFNIIQGRRNWYHSKVEFILVATSNLSILSCLFVCFLLSFMPQHSTAGSKVIVLIMSCWLSRAGADSTVHRGRRVH